MDLKITWKPFGTSIPDEKSDRKQQQLQSGKEKSEGLDHSIIRGCAILLSKAPDPAAGFALGKENLESVVKDTDNELLPQNKLKQWSAWFVSLTCPSLIFRNDGRTPK